MATLLIVDDNEQNLYMLRILFETNGYTVISASHGAEALELARAALPALVITDILMPVMDGFALCRQWKADPVLKDRPLVFYTATYTDSRDEEFATSLGADRFLVKPQDPSRLLTVVEELLGRNGADLSEPQDTENEFLRSHNLALFHKLEKKVADLEASHAALQRTYELRRDLENQLIQAQKMDSLGQIAGGIVHDFNNLLTIIGGAATMLALQSSDPGAVGQWAKRIQEAVQVGSGLSRQLMAFAKKQDLSLAPVDPALVLTQMRPLLATCLTAEVELVLGVVPPLALVLADANQLRQVFLNLVTNARDAIVPPGKVTVDAAVLDLDAAFVKHRGTDSPGSFVRIRFQDTGSGIPPEVISRIFDPFFTTKSEGRGVGLGLSVAYGIIQQHHGFFQVSSVVGVGSCFEIYLPVVPAGK